MSRKFVPVKEKQAKSCWHKLINSHTLYFMTQFHTIIDYKIFYFFYTLLALLTPSFHKKVHTYLNPQLKATVLLKYV